MTTEELKMLMAFQDAVVANEEYRRLRAEYEAAFQPFWELWQAMPDEESRLVDDYLHAAVELYQYFLVQALREAPRSG